MRKFTPSFFLLLAALFCFGNISVAQIVGTNTYLQGRFLEIGIYRNGAFGTCAANGAVPAGYHANAGSPWGGSTVMAEVYDWGQDGWTVGTPPYLGDYTITGTPFEGWEIQVGSARSQAFVGSFALCDPPYTSAGLGLSGGPVGYSNTAGSAKAFWAGSAMSGQLLINMETRVDTNASWVTMTVNLRNTGATPMSNVYYLRSCDPDIEQAWPGGGFYTNNTIVFQNDTAHRSYIRSRGGLTSAPFGLVAKDSRANVFAYGGWPMSSTVDLSTVYVSSAFPPGSGFGGDIGIGLLFNLGTIPAGDSVRFAYSYVFKDSFVVDSADNALCGGPLVAGTVVAAPSIACPLTPITLTLTGASAYSTTAYQWQSSPDSATWSNIAGATATVYSFTGLTTPTYYRCRVTCTASGASVYTPGVRINTTSVCPCGILFAGTVTCNVTTACPTTPITLSSTGYSSTGTTYQWQSSPDGTVWSNIPGATTIPYSFTGISATTYYRLIVTCTADGSSVTSAPVVVTVPSSCFCPGMNAGMPTASVDTVCSTMSITLGNTTYSAPGGTIQWQSSTDSVSWTDIPGATTVPYTFSGVTVTTYYRLVVTCTGTGTSMVSAGIKIVFTPVCPCTPLSAGTVTANVSTACATTAIVLNSTGYTATGTTLHWQASLDNSVWTNIPGATAVPYSFSGLTATTYYRLVVICTVTGISVPSASVLITYNPCPPTNVSSVETADIAIYPNPATEEIIVETVQGTFTSLSITDVTGRLLIKQPINSNVEKVNIKTLPSGVYNIVLKGEQAMEVRKVVKM